MKQILVSLTAGLLFTTGLALSGMTQPGKVVGFLDIFGAWDPSLLFVMCGAVTTYLLIHRGLAARRSAPLWAMRFSPPESSAIDRRLIGGAAIFGIGWGLSGYCPGPALAGLGAGTTSALWFVPAVLAGTMLHQRWSRGTGGPKHSDG